MRSGDFSHVLPLGLLPVSNILTTDVAFYFRYSRCCWVSLNSGGGSWSLSTTVNLTRRADTGQINSSPVSASIPIIRVQSGCSQVIRIPVEDPDGDVVRCRWATGSNECGGICHAFKHADLDEVQRNRKRHNSLHHTTAATSTDSFLFSSNSFVTLFSIKLNDITNKHGDETFAYHVTSHHYSFNPLSTNSWSKANFSFQYMASYVWYSMEIWQVISCLD